MKDWYTITNIDELDTPALVVYPARVRENIRNAIAMVGDPVRLRPHVKTHKSPNVTRLLLEAGVRQFKCATIAEAEMLAIEGAPDVLLAYQPIGPKATRLVELIRKYPGTKFSCLIDNEDAARAMAEVFSVAGLTVPVWLDINVGMDRTGIAAGPGAVRLWELAAGLKGVTPVGLHVYDGHIRDADLAAMTAKCDAAFAGVRALREALGGSEALGGGGIQVIAGGSPTFPVHARRSDVQCSPGTFVYWDKGYAGQFPDQPFLPAALVVSRVISLRGDTRICIDLGHKSIAAENELAKRVSFLNVQGLRPVGQSEEHLVLETAGGSGGGTPGQTAHGFRIGDVFYGVPFHVCPTVALYDRAYTVEDGRVTGEWKNTARDRKLSV
jgi:D-serine deaminase-like pyridoxal phosphate-dependent protein